MSRRSRKRRQIQNGQGTVAGLTEFNLVTVVDAEGFLWVAMWDGWAARRFTLYGASDRIIRLHCSHVTSVCFGGSDLMDLYITSGRVTETGPLPPEQLAKEPFAGALFQGQAGGARNAHESISRLVEAPRDAAGPAPDRPASFPTGPRRRADASPSWTRALDMWPGRCPAPRSTDCPPGTRHPRRSSAPR